MKAFGNVVLRFNLGLASMNALQGNYALACVNLGSALVVVLSDGLR